MRKSWPFGRHTQWREDVDAFVDGELTGERARRFETHLAGCDACMLLVGERGETKRLTTALPELRAPRSFRLNPGMLVEPSNVRERRGTPVIARLAQMTAGVAVAAFAVVVVADVSSNGDSSDSTLQATSDDDAAPMSVAEDAAGATPDSRDSAAGGSQAAVPTAAIPEVGSSVGAAANPTGSPEPRSPEPPSTGRDPTVSGVATVDSAYSGQPTQGPTLDEGSKSLTTEQGNDAPAAIGDAAIIDDSDDRGMRALMVVEIALATMAVVAGVAWLALRRRA